MSTALLRLCAARRNIDDEVEAKEVIALGAKLVEIMKEKLNFRKHANAFSEH